MHGDPVPENTKVRAAANGAGGTCNYRFDTTLFDDNQVQIGQMLLADAPGGKDVGVTSGFALVADRHGGAECGCGFGSILPTPAQAGIVTPLSACVGRLRQRSRHIGLRPPLSDAEWVRDGLEKDAQNFIILTIIRR